MDTRNSFMRFKFLNRIAPKAVPLKHIIHSELIILDSILAYNYAFNTKKPFPLGEAIIATSSYFSVLYAKRILKDRFKLAESTIAKNETDSFYYALYVLKGPFPLGEPAIANDIFLRNEYTKFVLKKDFYVDGVLISTYKPESENLTISENELNW